MPLCKSCSDVLHSCSECAHDALTSRGLEIGGAGFTETLSCQRCGTTWTHFLPNTCEGDSAPSWTVTTKRHTSLQSVARLLLRQRLAVGMLMAIAAYESFT
jgi:hypothetical protein